MAGNNRRQPQVAMLASIASGLQGEVQYGFRWYNRQMAQQFIDVPYFALSPDPLHTRITAEQIIAQDFDLIFCVGALASTVLYDLTKQMDNPPPIIFCFTSNPVARGFIKSEERSGTNMVGVEQSETFLQGEIDACVKMHAPGSRVLIPADDYMPATRSLDGARKLNNIWVDTMLNQLQEAGVGAEAVGFRGPEAMLDYVDKNAHLYDTVLLPSSVYGLNIHGAVGHYAQRGGAALCANLRSAVRASASYGFSESFIPTGVKAAQYAHQILFEGVRPHNMQTVRMPDHRQIMVNLSICLEQGVNPDEIIERAGPEALIFNERVGYPVQYHEDRDALKGLLENL